MQTVLVPVDGSPSGQRAVEWIGQQLGHQTGAHVHLVNVQPAMGAWEVTSHLGSREIAHWQAATSRSRTTRSGGVTACARIVSHSHC